MKKTKPVMPRKRPSRLTPLKQEILEKSLQGKSAVEIFHWLTEEKHVSTAYPSVTKFIRRHIASYHPPSEAVLIRQFLMLSQESRENVFAILAEIMGKKIHKQKQANKATQPVSESKREEITPLPYDFLKIQPGDSPAVVKLKKIAALNTTDLDHIPEELLKPLYEKQKE